MALLRRMSKTVGKQRKAAFQICNVAAVDPTCYAKLEEEIQSVTVENTSNVQIDVFIGADAGSLGFPIFSVDAGTVKQVPLTSSGSTVLTIVPHAAGGVGVARVTVSNQDHGYFVGGVTV